MYKISITPPVKAHTRGGLAVTLLELDVYEPRFALNGLIHLPGRRMICRSWSDEGICNLGPETFDLDTDDPLLAGVMAQLRDTRGW